MNNQVSPGCEHIKDGEVLCIDCELKYRRKEITALRADRDKLNADLRGCEKANREQSVLLTTTRRKANATLARAVEAINKYVSGQGSCGNIRMYSDEPYCGESEWPGGCPYCTLAKVGQEMEGETDK